MCMTHFYTWISAATSSVYFLAIHSKEYYLISNVRPFDYLIGSCSQPIFTFPAVTLIVIVVIQIYSQTTSWWIIRLMVLTVFVYRYMFISPVCLTWTVSVPVVLAGSQSAPPAHPETSEASWSGYETHPAKYMKTHTTLWFIIRTR